MEAEIEGKARELNGRDSEARFRNMADNALVMIWATEPDGSCTFLNKTWYDFTGQTPETALGSGWTEAVHPDDRARALETFLAANGRREDFRLDYRLRRKDGEYRFAIDSAGPRFGSQGEFLGYIGSVIDITEQKQIEEALQRAHHELEQRVLERTAQLIEVKDELAAELSAMRKFHHLSTQLLGQDELQPLLEEVLNATMVVQTADMGCVQLYNPEEEALEIVARRGLRDDFLEHFRLCHDESTVCGRALKRRVRIIIEDMLTDDKFAPHPSTAAADYRAGQSTPLFSRLGEVLGVISTYFRRPHCPSERELRLTDLYAHYAAGMIERKRVQMALQRSEAYLAEGQRLSHTASWAWNISTGEVYWSAEQFRIWGLDPAKGTPGYPDVLSYIHPDDRSRSQKTFEEAVREQKEYELAFRVVRPDRTIRYVNNLAHPVFNETGVLVEYVGTTIDTTERIQAEEQLRRSEARFRSYFDFGLIGMAMTSPTKGILEVNDELCRILNYSREELLKKSWEDMTHPDDLTIDMAQFNRVVAGEINGYTVDKRWIRKDGRVIDSIMSARCLRRADGSVDYFVGLVLDTTQRKQAEEELRRSEAHLAEAQRIGQVGSWIWNVATGECLWSREHFRIFGLDPDTFKPTKENTRRLIHPEDSPLIEQTLERAVRDQSNFEVDYRLIRPDGAIRYHHCMGRPVAKLQGDPAFIGMVVDVTERKEAEEALRKLQTELEHLTRVTVMEELAASIAHEINQPLGAIVNNSKACLRLLRKTRAQKQIRDGLADIVKDANRSSAIIARIRSLTKPSKPEKTPLPVQHLMTDVFTLARPEIESRRILVQLNLAPELLPISGDRVQLQQVLLNLIRNACDAMSDVPCEKRILAISCQHAELKGKPAVTLSVQDRGCGFKAEDATRLFEAFYTTKPHGMGMGLRISLSIAQAHGGKITASLNSGAPGATFSLLLPAIVGAK